MYLLGSVSGSLIKSPVSPKRVWSDRIIYGDLCVSESTSQSLSRLSEDNKLLEVLKLDYATVTVLCYLRRNTGCTPPLTVILTTPLYIIVTR